MRLRIFVRGDRPEHRPATFVTFVTASRIGGKFPERLFIKLPYFQGAYSFWVTKGDNNNFYIYII